MSEITKQDALRWLEMQRDAVNTEIVYAPQSEKKQYHQHLEIINALAERVQEMTAVEYMEAREEICNRHYRVGDCTPCPFNGAVCLLWRIEREELCRAVEIVRRWKEEQDGTN